MSNTPESAFSLEELEQHFLPSWAKQAPDARRFDKFEGRGEDRPSRDGGRAPWGDRPRRPAGRDRGPRPPGGERRGAGPGAGPDRGPRRQDGRGAAPRAEVREPEAPLPEIDLNVAPEEKGLESLARQVKLSGRAYPIFDIAHLIVRKPERYHVTFSVVKKADGAVAQPLWLCSLDDTLWLSEADVVEHLLRRHFDLFYQTDRLPTDPPKGTYTFVAQCGLSGIVLGPPNYHDYQTKLRKLHAERFGRMPFDMFKARVRIVKDEAVVKKWIEEQSFRTEYTALNVPEALKFPNRDEVEKHFRAVHLANIIRPVESHVVSGVAALQQPSMPLRRLARGTIEDLNRFPLKMVTLLSQRFAHMGLHFFKVNKTVIHVSVARPRFLDLVATPVSPGIRRIVDFVSTTPACNRKKLLDALAPTPAASPAVMTPATAPVAPEPEAAVATPTAAGEAPGPAAAGPSGLEPTPEQAALISDLHWLIHQGHVIEFANGRLEPAQKPKPKPVTPPRPPAQPATATAAPVPAGADPAMPAPPQGEPGHTPEDPVAEVEVDAPVTAAGPAPESAPDQPLSA